jgi:saccharopine dehydrogenase-like NADP-dependent oxidoreductase
VKRLVERVAVLGVGNVGAVVADLLREDGFQVVMADAEPGAEGVERVDARDREQLEALLDRVDAVVSCLPYSLTAAVARCAAGRGVHYLDLTEDRDASAAVRELADSARSALVPQCGLAPGFICAVGSSLGRQLDRPERIALRVGALPRSPNGALGYSFTWSPAGVVNEYLNDCEVLRGGKSATVPALSETERLVIDGRSYEAFATSGGLGTMCETFGGTVDRLDYKSIRYPGHCDLVRFFLQELRMSERRQEAEQILSRSYPPVDDDVVLLYAAAEGRSGERQVRGEFVRTYVPREIGGRQRTSISWTTAAGVVGVLQMLASDLLPRRGWVRQEDVDLEALFRTPAGSLLAAA